jgi:hypothetical protein
VSSRNVELSLAPIPPHVEASAALWIFEPVISTGPRAFRLRNLALIQSDLPGMVLASSARMVADSSDEESGIWLVEPVAREPGADVPLFTLEPDNLSGYALATNRASPYSPLTEPGGGGSREHWRLTPYQLCNGL